MDKHRGRKIIRLFRQKSSEEEIREALPDLYPRLWRFCIALTGSPDDASDLAQATTTRALEKAGQYKTGTHLDRWLFVMARRVWLNELRREKFRQGQGLVPVEDTPIPDEKADTEANIFAREVLSEMTKLPEAQRETVFLVYVEGFAYKEAAEMLDIPIGTVMSRLAAARKRLNERLGESNPEKVDHG